MQLGGMGGGTGEGKKGREERDGEKKLRARTKRGGGKGERS